MAIAYHNMRQVEEAVTYFKQLSEVDPYRLDNLDTYSDLLYVNYYSLRSQHEKAVVYFQKALKFHPGYLFLNSNLKGIFNLQIF